MLLDYFDWYHTVIVYDTAGVLTRIQGESLASALRDHPDYPRPYVISFNATLNPDYNEMLTEARRYARGMYMSVRMSNVCSLVRTATVDDVSAHELLRYRYVDSTYLSHSSYSMVTHSTHKLSSFHYILTDFSDVITLMHDLRVTL